MNKILIIISCLFSLLFVVGCGPTAEEITNDAWQLYEQSQYSEALAKFNEAISTDDTYADAHNGQGWSYAELDSLSKSVSGFENCTSLDNNLSDAHAGLALVYADLPDDSACINSANTLIQQEPSYEFSHKTSVTIEDIRIVKAKSCCNIGDFATALSEIQIIDPSFDADPESPAGQQAILNKLEDLIDQYR